MNFTDSEHEHVLLAMVLMFDARSCEDALIVDDVQAHTRWCLCLVKTNTISIMLKIWKTGLRSR
jgi:hypothetical protein